MPDTGTYKILSKVATFNLMLLIKAIAVLVGRKGGGANNQTNKTPGKTSSAAHQLSFTVVGENHVHMNI